ncbi:ATP-binding cassette sub- B member 5, partial [Quaeritorhiza haematococci]
MTVSNKASETSSPTAATTNQSGVTSPHTPPTPTPAPNLTTSPTSATLTTSKSDLTIINPVSSPRVPSTKKMADEQEKQLAPILPADAATVAGGGEGVDADNAVLEAEENGEGTRTVSGRVLARWRRMVRKWKKEEVEKVQADDPEAGFSKEGGRANKVPYWQLYRYVDRISLMYIVVGTVSGIINGAVAPLLNVLIGQVANIASRYESQYPNYEGNFLSDVTRLLLYLGILGATTLVFGYLQTFCWAIAAEKQTKIIREKYFSSILRQELAWFDKNPAGELTTRISSDVNTMYDGMGEK